MRSSGTPPPSAVQLHKEGNISAGTVASRKINERAGVPYMPWFVGSSAGTVASGKINKELEYLICQGLQEAGNERHNRNQIHEGSELTGKWPANR